MPSVTVELRNVEGTEAAMGWAGSHTVVVDRPEGKAGGKGLGFNGAELLGLAIGGCFCNDLRYVAAGLGAELGRIEVSVTVELGGEPLLATGATLGVHCEMADGSDASSIVEQAKDVCTVANSLRAGVPVQFVELGGRQGA
jgi:organic hydroperoxide reductase OsmC/OhrA